MKTKFYLFFAAISLQVYHYVSCDKDDTNSGGGGGGGNDNNQAPIELKPGVRHISHQPAMATLFNSPSMVITHL